MILKVRSKLKHNFYDRTIINHTFSGVIIFIVQATDQFSGLYYKSFTIVMTVASIIKLCLLSLFTIIAKASLSKDYKLRS
jgi:hypothetical protein